MKTGTSFCAYVFAWFIFLLSEVVAAAIILNIVSFGEVIWKKEEMFKPIWSNHALIMVISLIIVNGHGMVVFRLFPCCRTMIIKYIHALIHTFIILASVYGYFLIRNFKTANEHEHFTFQNLHTTFALVSAIFYGFQWIAAVFVYIYLYSNQRRRKLFASCHNFVGVCVLQILIVTACIELQEMNYKKHMEKYAEHSMLLMVIYGVLVNIIVLNPYLEWRLVGPL